MISCCFSMWNQDKNQYREIWSSVWIQWFSCKIPWIEKHPQSRGKLDDDVLRPHLTSMQSWLIVHRSVNIESELDENHVKFQLLGCDMSSSHWDCGKVSMKHPPAPFTEHCLHIHHHDLDYHFVLQLGNPISWGEWAVGGALWSTGVWAPHETGLPAVEPVRPGIICVHDQGLCRVWHNSL
jgi:hypothetical protein